MTTALVLDIMAKTGKKLSQLLTELPLYYIEKDKIECPNDVKEQVLQRLLKQVKGAAVDTIDGAKIRFPDKSSILIRPSGTEPLYRFYAEAKTQARAAELVKKHKAEVEEIKATLHKSNSK
jgi:phosphomannomutase/phosphoglucomutase